MDGDAAMLYARRLLDSFEANPPKPLFGACAKSALAPIITSLRVMGVYYEHDHYDTVPQVHPALTETEYLSVQSLKHLEEADDTHMSNRVKADIPGSYDSTTPLGFQSKDGGKEKSLTRNFALSDNNSKTDNAKGHTSSQQVAGDDSNKRRKRKGPETEEIFFVKPNQPGSFGTKTFSKENLIPVRPLDATENKKVIRMKDDKPPQSSSSSSSMWSSFSATTTSTFSLSNPGNYLDRCGMIQNPLASSILQDLGYCSKRCQEDELAEQYTKSGTGQKKPRSGWRWLISDRTYAFIVLLVLIANLIRMASYPFVTEGIAFAMIVIPSTWYLTTVTNNLWLFVSCTKPNHFLLFFQRWHVLYNDPVTRSLGLRGLTPVKHNRYVLLMMWSMIGLNMACCLVIMIMDSSFSAGLNKSFYITGERSVAMICVSMVVIFFCSSSWLATPGLFVALCKFITTHFEEFEEIFRLHVTAAGNQFPKHLRLLRECHLAMCDTVEILDRYVRMSSGFIFTIAVTNACFLIFVLVNNSMDKTTFGIVAFWLVASIFLLGLNVHYLGSVSKAMHSIGTSLLTIQTSGANKDQLAQLQMFLTKVNGPTMGFSVFGLITVTQDLILTLLSLYMTYAIILLQF